MSKLLHGKPIRQNLVASFIWQLILWGGALVFGAITSYSSYVEGVLLYKALINGAMVFLALTLGALFVALVIKWFQKSRSEAPPENEHTAASDAAEYAREIASRDARIRELEGKIDDLTRHVLTFEIDARQSQVRIGGGSEVRRIEANVILRCLKSVDRALAVREFHASLHRQTPNGEETIIPKEDVLVTFDHPSMGKVDFTGGWTISEPITGYRWFMFYLEIPPEVMGSLSREHFLRVAMYEGVRQEPFKQDFYVNDWQDARQSNSSITLKLNQ